MTSRHPLCAQVEEINMVRLTGADLDEAPHACVSRLYGGDVDFDHQRERVQLDPRIVAVKEFLCVVHSEEALRVGVQAPARRARGHICQDLCCD
eukprot:9689409-Heterocapsa_arctica.AAC.1